MDQLKTHWASVSTLISDRKKELDTELKRQEENDKLRQRFAEVANEFHGWLESVRTGLMEDSKSENLSLLDQRTNIERTLEKIEQHRPRLASIEELATKLSQRVILENKYTDHTMVALSQTFDQLRTVAARLHTAVQKQIEAVNATGVSEESLKEFNMMFKHKDKDQSGFLEPEELRSCLQAIGVLLPSDDQGDTHDSQFRAILASMDPNGDGRIGLTEFLTYMIQLNSDNVKSRSDIEEAFAALTRNGTQPYITKNELLRALTPEQAAYCMKNMPPYVDKNGHPVADAYDYQSYTANTFMP